jgi:hypothetical protein
MTPSGRGLTSCRFALDRSIRGGYQHGPCYPPRLLAGLGAKDLGYDAYVVVSSEDGFAAVFSIGEIFNSRLANNIVIAHTMDGDSVTDADGFAMSVVSEDSTGAVR